MSALNVLAAKLRQQAQSVGWLVLEKLVLLISGVLVGFWVVRSLGPDQFGRLSAALTITAVFAGLATMGLETAVLRRLASRSAAPAAILTSATALRLGGSVVHTAVCWLVSKLMFEESPDVAFAALIIAIGAVFRAPDVVGLWLQNEGRYARATVIRIATRGIGDFLRLALILRGASMEWFAAGFLLESLAASILFLHAGRALRATGAIDLPLTSALFREGRPIAISAILAACYARLDQVVLYNTLGAIDNGHYAAAVRISELFNLLITSIGTVAASHFGRLHRAADRDFDEQLLLYNRTMIFAGVLASAAVSMFAPQIVEIAYGPSFRAAADVLRIHAWSISLVFASIALEPWFYHYGKLDYYVIKTLLALLFAVPTTILATSHFGPQGTAAAVVATYAVSVFLTNALLPGTRRAFRFQMRTITGLAGETR